MAWMKPYRYQMIPVILKVPPKHLPQYTLPATCIELSRPELESIESKEALNDKLELF